MRTDLEVTPSEQPRPAGQKPSYWGVDLETTRRPGVVTSRQAPRPFPNTRYPPEQQQGESSAPVHGNSKPMPPVFSTAVPLKGLSGAIRRLAYSYPDYIARHWALKLLGDRVDALEHRLKKVAPLAAVMMGVAGAASLLRRR